MTGSAIDARSIVARATDVIATEVDGDAIIMSIEQGHCYGFDDIGSRIGRRSSSPPLSASSAPRCSRNTMSMRNPACATWSSFSTSWSASISSPSAMRRLARLVSLAAGDRRLFLEALLLMMLARLALRVLPFRHVAQALLRTTVEAPVTGAAAAMLIKRVRWSIGASVRHGPGGTLCFPQGIAAQIMLTRRGVVSTLYYGVAKSSDRGLDAHVWVRAGPQPVVGCEMASRFAVMTCFPQAQHAASSVGAAR